MDLKWHIKGQQIPVHFSVERFEVSPAPSETSARPSSSLANERVFRYVNYIIRVDAAREEAFKILFVLFASPEALVRRPRPFNFFGLLLLVELELGGLADKKLGAR